MITKDKCCEKAEIKNHNNRLNAEKMMNKLASMCGCPNRTEALSNDELARALREERK